MSKAAPVSDAFLTVQSITVAHPKMIDPPLIVRRRGARLASTANIMKYRVTNATPYSLDFYGYLSQLKNVRIVKKRPRRI